MEFRKVLALRGPNLWANFPVLEVWVDLKELKDSSSDELPGFNDRLMAWLPTMIEHRCSVGERGGFFERLRRGTYQAHILEHVTLELQTLAGTEAGFGRARETSEEGVYKVAIEYEVEELARACLDVARELCLAAVHNRPYDVQAEIRKLQELARRVRPTAGTSAILKAARERDIPVRQLTPAGLLQLGHGARQRRALAPQTDRTGALAESIAQDKVLTQSLLRAAGVPVSDDQTAGEKWRLLVVGERVVAAVHRAPAPTAGSNGKAADVTARVHPKVAAHAVEAARAIGLDVAGIELVASDITRPLEELGGVITAVDARPDIGAYDGHCSDAASRIGSAIVAQMFPEGQTGRIPIVAVTGVNGKTTTTRLLAHIVARSHRCVGMTCTEGIYIDGRRIETGDCSGPRSARAVLQNSKVEAAVLETARGGILREGLGFDRCDVAIVTNIAEGDHLGLAGIDTLEQLARVKRTPVDVVAPGGAAVLKADDPLVVEMASRCPGSVVFFARNGNHPVIAQHRAINGRAAFVRDQHMILAEGSHEIRLAGLDRVPLTHGGRIGFQVENALAAAAAAWSLGIPCEVIRVGLESFAADLDQAPGRFNLLEVNGAAVIMDYGHNVSSLASLIEALGQFPHRRRTAVYSAAGDRRNSDLLRQAELLGDAFDRVILYEDPNCIRGRKPKEISNLFRQGMAAGKRVRQIEEIDGAVKSVEVALASVGPGDLLLVQVDLVDETVELIRRQFTSQGEGREIDLKEALASFRPMVAAKA